MKKIKNIDLVILAILYTITRITIQLTNNKIFGTINLIVWICLLVYLFIANSKTHKRIGNTKFYLKSMALAIIAYLLAYFAMGFITGFSKSGYDRSIHGILMNTLKYILPIIGIELFRSNVLIPNKEKKSVIVLFTILLILMELDYSLIYNNLANTERFFQYIATRVLGIITYNIVFSFLVFKGSHPMNLIFRIPKEMFLLVIPFYPSNWFMESVFNLLTPAILYFLYRYIITYREKHKASRRTQGISKPGLIFAVVFSVLLMLFMLGFFKCEPVGILSNSMYPTFSRGDVLIYEKFDESYLKNLEKGSIIIYRIGNQTVAHRVVNVIQENGETLYQTMGDNNNAPDVKYVKVSQIEGVYRFHIKYIGYPSVWLHDFFNEQEAIVETK